MQELVFSVIDHGPQTPQVIRSLLAPFEARTGISVYVELMKWSNARPRLVETALRGGRLDVSEVGSTWMGDLAALRGLRPYSLEELEQIGPAPAFLPARWRDHLPPGAPVWSIPWICDALVIHYHPSMLRQAGLNPSTAFASLPALANSLQTLRAAGCQIPMALPRPDFDYLLLNLMALWVRTAGAHLLSDNGRQALFDELRASTAILDFFCLYRTISEEGLVQLERRAPNGVFHSRLAASAPAGTWMKSNAPPGDDPDWQAVPLPGTPVIGGSGLVVWQSSRAPQAALELVGYLTSSEVMAEFGAACHVYPARAAAFDRPPFSADPVLRATRQSLEAGRPFRSIPLWTLLEEHLTLAANDICRAIFQNPNTDLDNLVPNRLAQAAESLNQSLSRQ